MFYVSKLKQTNAYVLHLDAIVPLLKLLDIFHTFYIYFNLKYPSELWYMYVILTSIYTRVSLSELVPLSRPPLCDSLTERTRYPNKVFG